MNAAEWNAKYPVGTPVVIAADEVARIKSTAHGGDLGLPADGRTVTARFGGEEDFSAYDHLVAVVGVCGGVEMRHVTPIDVVSYRCEQCRTTLSADRWPTTNGRMSCPFCSRWDPVTVEAE